MAGFCWSVNGKSIEYTKYLLSQQTVIVVVYRTFYFYYNISFMWMCSTTKNAVKKKVLK